VDAEIPFRNFTLLLERTARTMSEVDAYDYHLPPELIAQEPRPERVDARLLVVDRAANSIEHRHIRDLPELLSSGDALVLNDTKVVPARLIGRRVATGGKWEGLFLSRTDEGLWRLLCKARGHMKPGEQIELVNRRGREDVCLRLVEKGEGGVWIVYPESEEDVWDLLDRVGRVPLPHYIRHGEMTDDDRRRYQTIYAREPGSAAAPTAGLHFSETLLRRLIDVGVTPVRVTLHVGVGTFRPIKADTLAEHVMHREWCKVDEAAVERINQLRADGGRVVAVGTTAVRTLETASQGGALEPFEGETDLFIRPGYEFRTVDALLTNFHLPRSTLLVLVRTFGGDDLIRRAYEAAIAEKYRFYSYGDAMLIL
jgi:S-adenosylmethionine:tRNA ribosyltransferase-isomerase